MVCVTRFTLTRLIVTAILLGLATCLATHAMRRPIGWVLGALFFERSSSVIVRHLDALLIIGTLVFQSACTPTPIASPETFQEGNAGASAIETIPLTTTTVAATVGPQEVEQPPRGNRKLGSSLSQLLEAYQRGGLADAQTFAEMHRMRLDDGRVQVEVVVAREAVSDLREAIEVMDGEYQGHHENLLQAWIPLEALELLAQRSDVQVIREPRRAAP